MATAFHALSAPFSASVAAWAKGSPNRKNWTEAEANGTGFVLDIPFRCKAAKEIRDLAKLCGARFDGGTKSWSVAYSALTPLKLNTLNALGIIKAAIPAPKASYAPRGMGLRYIVLAIPFEEKDAAKSAGARWSVADKFWYMTVDTSTAFRDALLPFEDKGWVDHAKTAAIATKCGIASHQYTPLTNRSTASKCVFAAPQGTEYFRQAPLRRSRYAPKRNPNHNPVPVVSAPAGNQQTPRTLGTQIYPVDQSTIALCDYLKAVIGGTIPDSKWTVRTIWRSGNRNTWAVKHWCFNPQCTVVVCLDRFVHRPDGFGNFRNFDSRPWVPADRNVLVHDIFVYSKEDARTTWNALLNTQIPEAKWFPLLHPPRIDKGGAADSGVGELGVLASHPQGNGSPSATLEMTSLDLFMSIFSQGSLFENVASRGEIASILSILTDRQSGQRDKWMGVAY